MNQMFEAWDDPDNDSIAFATVESIHDQKKKGLISEKAVLLYRVEADRKSIGVRATHLTGIRLDELL